MDVFKELPLKKQVYMEMLFQNCTEEVKYYMSMAEVQENQTLIEAGERCSNIYIILSGKVTGIEWPMTGRPYFFKDYGPGDFFGIRQSGDLAFSLADIYQDSRILQQASEEAQRILTQDRELELPEHGELRKRVRSQFDGQAELLNL